VRQHTDAQVAQLAKCSKGRCNEVTCEILITSLGVLTPLLTPARAAFREEHPELTVKFLTDERVFRLEYGEAHLAVRAGSPPDQPDNVVQKFYTQGFALYASKKYIERHGLPESLDDVGDHIFIGSAEENPRAPFFAWLKQNIPAKNIGFQVNQITATRPALKAGIGIGFSTNWAEADDDDIVRVFPTRPEWNGQLWLVTHVDLHRTAKVQTCVNFLKEWAKRWPAYDA